MSNLKKQLYDRETNQNISPITDTEAVFTPDGRTAEQRNTDQMAKLESELSGRGSYARASVYPTLNLGIFSTMEAANAKLDEIYTTSETKYHGKLRLSVNGTTMWIEQYQVNYQQRYWMQIVYGPFAKNANGTALVQDFGKAHITYRVKNGVADIPWSDYQIEGLNLATINGQSLTEGGDIVVTEQGVLPIDDHLDVSSENAVSNCIIALAFERLETMIEEMGLKTDLIKIAEITREVIILEEEQYMGSDGEIILSLSGYEEPTDNPIVILRVPDGSSYKYYSQWDASPYYKADEDINVNEDYFVIYDNSKVEILHYNTTTGRIVSTYIENQSISPIVQATYWCTSSELGTVNDGDFWYDTTSGKLKKCRDASEEYWEEFGVGVLLVNNPNDNKVYEVDNTRPGTISRFLDEGDLQDINARIDNIDVEKNKEIYYVKYWGSDTTSQEYRGLNIGDCWYDPSEHAIKIKTGTDTFTTVTPKVAFLFNIQEAEFYVYEDGETAVYDRMLTTKDLYTGGDIVNKINEKIAANETKYLGNIYEVKWWQTTQPENAEIGDYWYDPDFSDLRIITSTSPFRSTPINTSSKGSILMRRLDGDSTYNGKVYELDFRGEEMRLLDENDIIDTESRFTNLENNKASVQSVNDEKRQREEADEALQGQIDVLTEDTLPPLSNEVATITADLKNRIVAPLGALVTSASVENISLSSYLSNYYYDLVYDTTTKKLLIRRRPAAGSIGTVIYYQNWNVSGRAPSYEANKASDYNIQPSSEYRTTTAVDAPLKGFYYITNNEDLTIYKWNVDAATLVKTGTGEGGGDVDVDVVGNDIIIGNYTVHTKTVNGNTILGEGNINIEVEGIDKYINNPAYPEYWLSSEQKQNIVYASDYHHWPIAWYGGEVQNVNIEDTSYNGKVFMPSECMYNLHQLEEARINNNNVKLDTSRNVFVLQIESKYYINWSNAYEYNNDDLSSPVPHKLFVKNIYTEHTDDSGNGMGSDESHAGKWYKWYEPTWGSSLNRPVTKYWDGNNWIDPYTNLTNFREAFQQCATNNKGNITLSPNKIYYYEIAGSNSDQRVNIVNKSYFVIEGNNSCILLRNTYSGSSGTGHTQEFITFKNCNHGVMRNISVVSVRDNVTGSPSMDTEPRFCCTGSNVSLLHIWENNKDLRFENIYTFGMDHDIYIKSENSHGDIINRNILFHNIKGVLTNGNTIRDVDGLVVNNYDLLLDGYANGGEHVVYFQACAGVVTFRNSTIRQSAPYRQRMISWASGSGSNSSNSLQELIFENCDIAGICLIAGMYTRNKLKMINCSIRAITEYSAGQQLALGRSDYMIGLNNGDCDLINCTIIAPKYFMSCKDSATWNIVNIDGCRFIRCPKDDGTIDTSSAFFDNFVGRYSLKNTKVWYATSSRDAVSPTRVLDNSQIVKWLGLTNGKEEESLKLRILAIGNSFTGDAFVYLPFILKAANIDVEVGYLHKSNLDITTANSEFNSVSNTYTLYYVDTEVESAWKTLYTTYSPRLAVEYRKWDIITIQQSSTQSVDSSSFSNVGALIDKILGYAKPNVSIGWVVNHSRYSLDQPSTILTNCKNAYEGNPITFVIPYGTAIFDARQNQTLAAIGSSTHNNLWYSDDIHLQDGLPCYIAALTAAQAIYEKFYPKKSVLGDTFVPNSAWYETNDSKIVQKHGDPIGITDANRRLAQKVAIMANKFKFEIKSI